MKLFPLAVATLFSGCVNGEYHQPLGRTVYFPKIEPPVFQAPAPYQSKNSQIVPDGNGGYEVWNGDGTTAHMVPDGHGGWTVWR